MWLRRSLTTRRRSRAEAHARVKCLTRRVEQFCSRGRKTTTQTGNLRYRTGDEFMLKGFLETTDKEMCPAKKAGKNLVSLLVNLCCHNGWLQLLCNSLSGRLCVEGSGRLTSSQVATVDPNPDAMPCNSGQHREQKTLCLCGICKPVQLPATIDRTLVAGAGRRFT